MLNKETAIKLFSDLKRKEDIFSKDPTLLNKANLKKQENTCIKEFDYIVKLGASKYKAFNNYQDLLQEGRIALMSALKTYEEAKGDIFWWCHKYVDTKIYRKANKHFVVDIPLVKAKSMEIKSLYLDNLNYSKSSTCIEESNVDSIYENSEKIAILKKAIDSLDENQKSIVKKYLASDLNKKTISTLDKRQLTKSLNKIKKFVKNY
jgi:DNA-directed RNA polymerase specialized sigma subunit